jgi:predicted ATPase
MRLHKLWISKYKNIVDQTFEFKDDLFTLFVGQNGLGKSNTLEVLLLIFKELDLSDTSKVKLDKLNSELYFDFELMYKCKGNHICINKRSSLFDIVIGPTNIIDQKSFTIKSFLSKKSEFLPDFVLGYYSGENRRIEQLFKEHDSNRTRKLKKGDIQKPLGGYFFTDQNLGELLFFVLWIYKDRSPFKEKISMLFEDYLKIDNNSKVSISFQSPDYYKPEKNINTGTFLENIQFGNVEFPFWDLKGLNHQFLRSTYDSHTGYSLPISYFDDNINKDVLEFPHLIFDNLLDDLGSNFESPLVAFDCLESLNRLGAIKEITSTIVKNGQSISHNFSELSEGEQQLLTIVGLTLITGNDDVLYLFDEPDTHLNPVWQRDLIKSLREFNLNDNNSQFVIATHSPLIVQSTEHANVFLFKKDVDGNPIVDSNDHHIHNWRIDQVLQSEYFQIDNARPSYLDEFMAMRLNILRKDELTKSDEADLKEIENSMGYLPTGETIEEIKSKILIRKIAELNKNRS